MGNICDVSGSILSKSPDLLASTAECSRSVVHVTIKMCYVRGVAQSAQAAVAPGAIKKGARSTSKNPVAAKKPK